MAIDPSIALGVRGIELQNPLNALAQYSQIQGFQNQNAMAQLQMREAEAAAQEKNMLRRLDPTAADYESQLFKVSPQLGINFRKEQAATEASKAATASSLAAAAKSKQEVLGQALRDISQRPSDANITAHTEDIQASPLFSAEEKAKALVTQQTLLAMPFEQRQAYLASQGAKPSDLKPTTQTVNRGGATEVIQVPAFGGAPSTVGSYADVPVPAAVEEQKKRIAREGRAPSAPSITQIVDPTNPNQMITIDARRYQGGGAGTPGVIGVAGKEPSAALRINKAEQGKSQLADDLDNLRAAFQTLDEMRAIPSTERNVVSNLMSATQASGVGQMLGRAGGSPEQVERDVINSARMRLVNSIKNATGMSAQQLNSNVELQTMLRSISDPGQSVEAALRIIDDIDNAYVKGSGALPKRNQPAAAPATQGTGGFKYLGKENK
jgi:hypothetical protein